MWICHMFAFVKDGFVQFELHEKSDLIRRFAWKLINQSNDSNKILIIQLQYGRIQNEE